ncbi:MAG TPA: type II secretion system F family protein [Candidatus Cybelea sp.]|nr:type II secretion system F family protein [Candidatus Cybelea sp.]
MPAGIMLLISVLFAISAFLLTLSLIPSKSALSEQLEVLKSRQEPKKDPLPAPIMERIMPPDRRAYLTKKLAEAGWYTTTPVQFVMRMIGGAFFGVVLSLVAWKIIDFSITYLIPVMLGVTFCAGYAPMFMLNNAIEARKGAIQKGLPEFLDMVAATVSAGLALNAALGYAVEAVPGPLGDEIKEALSEIRLGRARADALKAVGDRTNQTALRNALRVMTQAEKLGANISKMLNDLAADARHQRLMLVEEMAAKLPVKMVFPMVLFMIPAIVTVIFGSVAANYFAPK